MISPYTAAWGREVLLPTRERLGLTREQLAAEALTSATTIRNLECGRVSRPWPLTLLRVCRALGLPQPVMGPLDERIVLCLYDVPAQHARHILAAALREFVTSRRNAPLFASLVAAGHSRHVQALYAAAVIAECEVADRLLDLLRFPYRARARARKGARARIHNPAPTKEIRPHAQTTPNAPWGCATLPTLREAAGLTRATLALRATLAEKTLRDIEAGRVEATPEQRARLTTVLEIAKLCPAGALLIPFDDPKWREVLREALTDYAEKRRDPSAYVETLYGAMKSAAKARHVEWAADEAAMARALLAQLRAYS